METSSLRIVVSLVQTVLRTEIQAFMEKIAFILRKFAENKAAILRKLLIVCV